MQFPISAQINRMVQTMNHLADVYIRKHYSLTFSRYQLLDTLRYTGPTTQHALAVAMEVSDTVISRMMKALKDQNFISISSDPSHGRKHIIALTDFGEKQILNLGTVLERAFQNVLEKSIADPQRFGDEINAVLTTLRNEGEIV